MKARRELADRTKVYEWLRTLPKIRGKLTDSFYQRVKGKIFSVFVIVFVFCFVVVNFLCLLRYQRERKTPIYFS